MQNQSETKYNSMSLSNSKTSSCFQSCVKAENQPPAPIPMSLGKSSAQKEKYEEMPRCDMEDDVKFTSLEEWNRYCYPKEPRRQVSLYMTPRYPAKKSKRRRSRKKSSKGEADTDSEKKKLPVEKKKPPTEKTVVKQVKGEGEKKLKTPPRKITTPPSGEVVTLKPNKTSRNINWKKPPKFPVKQTTTSKLRKDFWFADCGKYRVKAYRGDFSNLPEELAKDKELYESFFKYRQEAVNRKPTPIAKNIVSKLSTTKPNLVERKVFQRRSPVLPGYLRKTSLEKLADKGARFNLAKKPLIEVKHTLTSTLRKKQDTLPCDKPRTPTFWHGSAQELQDLKKKIKERRRIMQEKWKQNVKAIHSITFDRTNKLKKFDRLVNSSLNNLMVISSAFTSDTGALKHFNVPQEEKSDVKIICNKNLKSDAILKVGSSLQVSRVNDLKQWDVNEDRINKGKKGSSGLEKLKNVAKWMLPPSIPIQQSLTSARRQKSKIK